MKRKIETCTAARRRFAAMLQSAMAELGLEADDLRRIFPRVRRDTVESWILMGVTPRSPYFIPLCNEFGFDPEEFMPKPVILPRPMTPRDFGAIFADAREAMGVTQTVLSDYVGIHYITLLDIEKGHAIPREKTMKDLCRVLGLDFDEMKKKRAAALAGAAAQRKSES